MRKIGFLTIPSYLILILISASCNKSDIKKDKADEVMSDQELIAQANSFFKTNIDNNNFQNNGPQNPRQKLNKTALWERAFVRTSSKGEVVTVPIKYEKTFNFSFEQGTKLSLEKLSNLVIFKNPSGNLVAQVVTYVSKGATTTYEDVDKTFEGFVFVDDWYGNRINRFMIEDGKRFVVKNNVTGSTQRETTDGCYSIVWYICDDDGGQLSNCQYLFTEYAAACGQSLEPCFESCGGEEYTEFERERAYVANPVWYPLDVPQEFGGGRVKETDIVYCRMNDRRPERNRFTGTHYYGPNVNLVLNSGIYPHTFSNVSAPGTVLSNTLMMVTGRGRLNFPNVAYIDYEQTIQYSLYGLDWRPL